MIKVSIFSYFGINPGSLTQQIKEIIKHGENDFHFLSKVDRRIDISKLLNNFVSDSVLNLLGEFNFVRTETDNKKSQLSLSSVYHTNLI